MSPLLNIKSDFILRPATLDDCVLFFEWVNDEDVRRHSFHTEKIEWQHHKKWFHNKMNSQQSKLFVLSKNNIPIGQCRLDKEQEFWLIDYSIDKKYRGKSYGNIIVQMLIEKDYSPIKAIVKKNNIGSVKVFKNNFT